MEQQTKNCPYCGEEIMVAAKKCKHCGEWLEPKETVSASAEMPSKVEEPQMNEQSGSTENKVAPVESYYFSTTKKLVVGTIAAVLVILTIWFNVFPPEIEFSYIFGTISYGALFLLLSLLVLLYLATLFDEQRKSRIYLNRNGDLDIETPREYKPLSVSPVSKVIGRANIYGQKNLSLFSYHDGRVLVRNSKGHEIEGALSDLTFAYKMDKNKATGEWYIYQFIISDNNGKKVQFNRHNTLFTDEEYADIEMLLSLSGMVKESKISKFTRVTDSVLSKIKELDFSDLASSTIELAGSTATSKLSNAVGLYAKKRIYDRLSDKKKSLWAKIKKYSLWLIAGLIVLALIWANVEIAINTYGSNDGETEYNYEQEVYDDSVDYVEDTEYAEDSEESTIEIADEDGFIIEFNGSIGEYPIQMVLNLKDINNYNQCDVVGKYCYTSTGGVIMLYGEKRGDRMILNEYTNGNLTGTFDGIFTIYGHFASFEYAGTFTTSQGNSYEFDLMGN